MPAVGLAGLVGVAAGCGPDVPLGVIRQGHAVTVEDIAVREEMIAAQQTTLHRLRCQFGADTQVVPGGCANGLPVLSVPAPAPFTGMPDHRAVAERDEFIRLQEQLLNQYRCRFGVDAHAVPGGCPKRPGQ